MNNLKQYREKRNIKQTDLAKMIGCGRSYICQLENGQRKMTMKMASRISSVLYCQPSELIGGDALKYDQSFIDSCKSILDEYFPIVFSTNNGLSNNDNNIFEILMALVRSQLTDDQIKIIHDMTLTMVKANLGDKK